MLYEVNFVLNLDYIAYLLIGIAVGYLVTLGATGGPTASERAMHDVEVKKEFLRMNSELAKGRIK